MGASPEAVLRFARVDAFDRGALPGEAFPDTRCGEREVAKIRLLRCDARLTRLRGAKIFLYCVMSSVMTDPCLLSSSLQGSADAFRYYESQRRFGKVHLEL